MHSSQCFIHCALTVVKRDRQTDSKIDRPDYRFRPKPFDFKLLRNINSVVSELLAGIVGKYQAVVTLTVQAPSDS